MSKSNLVILLICLLVAASGLCDPVPTTLNDFFLPGSQPGQSGNLETPSKCDNCHGGYDTVVEPAFNWRGSMMAQAARDPLFYACLTIANQDAPASGDLCIRCHSPAGWLEGRSTPTDGSALNNNDREGVQCDFCHKVVRPTPLGTNPYPDDPDYTADTYPADQSYLAIISPIPDYPANGMYVADNDNAKRGPFVDANATHQMFYSPYHSLAAICGTCHDVSNPAFARNPDGTYSPNSFDQPSPSFTPYDQFPIERTYSEWLMSAYNSAEGIYAPQFGGNKDTVATCQDCHMRDISGVACNKAGGVYRDDLPYHDLTGGNTFIPLLIDSVFPGETFPGTLAAGISRAYNMLTKAASLEVTAAAVDGIHELNVRVTNETGHKLPSGYPEGRRIWLNIRAFNQSGDMVYESGAYDTASGTLTHDTDAKIYEIKPGIADDVSSVTGYPTGPSFHFAVNSKIYFDNRIPPRGFTNANFEAIQSPPIGYSYSDGQYWDDTPYLIPGTAARIAVTLYYQTTSKEYVEFLRDENVTDDWGEVFYNLWASNGKSAPVVMQTDTVLVTPLSNNNPPVLDPVGPQAGVADSLLVFAVTAHDDDGTIPVISLDPLPEGAIFIDQGDGTAEFSWTPTIAQVGQYPVSITASDGEDIDTESVLITVIESGNYVCGDANGDEAVNIGDGVYIINYVFKGGPAPDPLCAADPNGDGDVNVGDGVYVVNYVFKDGPPPVEPCCP